MSHAATNWAIRQRGLKPATKIVLWYLADCHNAHTGQCNPKQSTLADECEMSRSTVNLHLDKLEELGLIRRVQTVDSASKKKRPTHYILALDGEISSVSENQTRSQDVVPPCPEIGHGAVSEKTEKPCPKNEQSHVRNSDIKNLGREPGKEPEQAGRQAAHAKAPTIDVDAVLDDLIRALGLDNRPLSPYWLPNAASANVLSWHLDLGLSHDEIISTARQSRQQHDTAPRGPRALNRAMQAAAAGKSPVPLKPIPGGPQNDRARFDIAHREYVRRLAAGEIQRGPDPSDPFAGR